MVRERVADSIAGGHARGLGAFFGRQLVGVIVWTQAGNDQEVTWTSAVLAVALGYQAHGIGTRLKDEQVLLALEQGVNSIVSLVHRDNEHMKKVLRQQGATMVLDPSDHRRQYLICEIKLR